VPRARLSRGWRYGQWRFPRKVSAVTLVDCSGDTRRGRNRRGITLECSRRAGVDSGVPTPLSRRPYGAERWLPERVLLAWPAADSYVIRPSESQAALPTTCRSSTGKCAGRYSRALLAPRDAASPLVPRGVAATSSLGPPLHVRVRGEWDHPLPKGSDPWKRLSQSLLRRPHATPSRRPRQPRRKTLRETRTRGRLVDR
jgi:hypothetical protein